MDYNSRFDNGEGNLAIKYTGLSGQSTAGVSADCNCGEDRSTTVIVATETDPAVSKDVSITQTGIREQFIPADEETGMMGSDDSLFLTLKDDLSSTDIPKECELEKNLLISFRTYGKHNLDDDALTLEDLSGNGNTIELLGYSEVMKSSNDGYNGNLDLRQIFKQSFVTESGGTGRVYGTIEGNTCHVTHVVDTNRRFLEISEGVVSVDPMYIKVTGISADKPLVYEEPNQESLYFKMEKDGIYKLPAAQSSNIGLIIPVAGDCDVTIEIFDTYHGGLVLGGDNNVYCETFENNTISKENGMTVVMLRKLLGESDTYSLGLTDANNNTDFTMEEGSSCKLFGDTFTVESPLNHDLFSYMTTGGYNSEFGFNFTESKDNLNCKLVVGKRDMVIYALEIYNRKLTELELQNIKTRLMDEYYENVMKYYQELDVRPYEMSNESADKEVLKDYSGKGNDITLNNFDFSGMSGYGGYKENYNSAEWLVAPSRVDATKDENTIHVTSVKDPTISVYFQGTSWQPEKTVPSYKVKITGLKDGQNISYLYTGTLILKILKDGVYTLPPFGFAGGSNSYGFAFNVIQESCDITIEQIPEYPGSLVTDGVDDYGVCDKFPVLTPDKGFTVIATRKFIDDTLYGSIVSTEYKNGEGQTIGAFDFESYNDKYNTTSFGNTVELDSFEKGVFSYMTSESYNGTHIDKGIYESGFDNGLSIFASKVYNYSGRNSKVALENLHVYSRDLSADEIAYVKNKMLSQHTLLTEEYLVGEWDNETKPAAATTVYGSKEYGDDWHAYLIDCTDNAGEYTTPVGELNRDNFLRFTNGSFAPTVGITEEMRSACDVELYLNPEHTEKYCDAGAFNAEAFYEEYGVSQKLYDATGAEVRVLRPWETTETKYSVAHCKQQDMYVVDGVEGWSGKQWRGIFRYPIVWDGIDISKWKLSPTAFFTAPVCTVDNKSRSFFFLYQGETNCTGGAGQDGVITMFQEQRTYPRVADMTAITSMQKARANNADASRTYPFAEGGYMSIDAYITAMEALYGTKAFFANTMFGSGISGNDACTDEETWKQNGGVRYKESDGSNWLYQRFYQNPVFLAQDGETKYWNYWLNMEHPKEQCMESQMAYSYAMETGVQEGVEFDFYGSTYWYKKVEGAEDGKMNAIVYKKMTVQNVIMNIEGGTKNYDIEVILRMSLVGGRSLQGDIFQYIQGGVEVVGLAENTITNNNGFPADIYAEYDQMKWHSETSYNKADAGVFDFESSYRKVAENFPIIGNGYGMEKFPGVPFKKVAGGNLLTQGECAYFYDNIYWNIVQGARYRVGLRARGFAHYSTCSPRLCYAIYAASLSSRISAGSAQCRLAAQP